jgi:hypothetical protein
VEDKAIIKIRAGTYRERLILARPITLEASPEVRTSSDLRAGQVSICPLNANTVKSAGTCDQASLAGLPTLCNARHIYNS